MAERRNAIYICADLQYGVQEITSKLRGAQYKLYEAIDEKNDELKVDFRIENAHSMISDAYITSDQEKYLIAFAQGYGRDAQNALLKILEEPPHNVVIYLIAPRKSVFLPTICSRLPIYYIKTAKAVRQPMIDFAKMDIKTIYDFLKSKDNYYLEKERAKDFIASSFDYVKTLNIQNAYLRQKVLNMITRSYKMVSLNSTAANALLPLLLTILECNAGTKNYR